MNKSGFWYEKVVFNGTGELRIEHSLSSGLSGYFVARPVLPTHYPGYWESTVILNTRISFRNNTHETLSRRKGLLKSGKLTEISHYAQWCLCTEYLNEQGMKTIVMSRA
ncbi:hypothetical protein AVEN_254094-1 [Araneus ventricosus]|uniref:Uncharacterized protein n=1 Tax=Araneus ventricosus TaxID=182803 RepID=A0A4Y2C0C2_ARAVE|nr:hypothetical protein AVEN_254094-1 [Araneus ventricosus]